MRVLVTGGAGYIGSHVAVRLHARGHEVRVIDNLSTGHADSVTGIDFVEADLRSPGDLGIAFAGGPWDAVVHLAASSLVGESMESPGLYYENNVVAGLHLLEAMRRGGIQNLVFSSSAAVYGEPDATLITEEQPPRPQNPYGSTKLAFEKMLRWYDAAHGLRSVSLRYFNVAGADIDRDLGEDHEPETHLIPNLLKAAMGRGGAFKLFGEDYPTPDGTCIRDYIHVADVAAAHSLALEHLFGGGSTRVYNLGNGAGFSVREVWDAARRITGREIPLEVVAGRPGDPPGLVAAADRIGRELGWKPQYPDPESMIGSAWRWMERHPDGYKTGREPSGGAAAPHRSGGESRPAGMPAGFEKERVTKSDGRYLIYYKFSDRGEDPDYNGESGGNERE